jgi:hypothetical protein
VDKLVVARLWRVLKLLEGVDHFVVDGERCLASLVLVAERVLAVRGLEGAHLRLDLLKLPLGFEDLVRPSLAQ